MSVSSKHRIMRLPGKDVESQGHQKPQTLAQRRRMWVEKLEGLEKEIEEDDRLVVEAAVKGLRGRLPTLELYAKRDACKRVLKLLDQLEDDDGG